MAIVAVLCADLAFASPASAGTLTAPTWTVMDPRTNIAGNRYDYSFTTATAGTVSRITATVPTGTSGSDRYLALNGVSSNNASIPAAAAANPTSDFDIRVKFSKKDWTDGSEQTLISRWGGPDQLAYLLTSHGPNIYLYTTSDGTTATITGGAITLPASFRTPTVKWLRVVRSQSNGTVTYMTSTDAISWTVIEVKANPTNAVFATSTAPLVIGGQQFGAPLNGKIYYADLRTSAGGTTSPSSCSTPGVVNCFDPNNDTVGGTSWASTSVTGETWTVNRSGTNAPADIASDLSVMNITGLAGGGTAQLREIDAQASYVLPAPQSVPASTAIKLGLAGMINTHLSGSYATVLTTLDASSTAIDTSPSSPGVSITQPLINSFAGRGGLFQSAVAPTAVNLSPTGIAIDGNTVYVSDAYYNVVWSYDKTANTVSRYAGSGITGNPAASTGAALNAPINTLFGLSVDGGGNLYFADLYNQVLQRVDKTTGQVSRKAGGSIYGYSGDGGTATGAGFSFLSGSAFDAAGNAYIVDEANHRIRRVDATTGIIDTYAGNGTAAYAGDGGQATSASLSSPSGIAIDAAGNVFIVDRANQVVRRVDAVSKVITTVAGNNVYGFSGDNGPATSARMSNPSKIAIAPSGDLYISDTSNARIRKVSGGVITTVAGTGAVGLAGDGGPATSAVMSNPGSLSVDSSGNVWLCDVGNSRVRKIDTSGVITTAIGTGGSSQTGDGGPVGKSDISPVAATSTKDGTIFMASDHTIRKIDPFGTITRVAGTSVPGFSGDGGPALAATLRNPRSISVASDGTIYFTDDNNIRIRSVSPGGTINTLASIAATSVAVHPTTGDIWSTTTCQIRKTTPGGVTTVVAGTTTCGTSGDFGPGSAAQFSSPTALTFNSKGDAYFIDKSGLLVRKLEAATDIVTTVSGNGAGPSGGAPARTAAASRMTALAIDPMDRIFIQDPRIVRMFKDGGGVYTVAGNNGYGMSGDGGSATAASIANSAGNNGGPNWGALTFSNGDLVLGDQGSRTLRKVATSIPMAPLVNNDSMSVPMSTQRQWPILSNDWSRSGQMDPSSVTVVAQPTNGTVALSTPSTEAATMQAVYTPTTGYMGNDSFTYRACDTTRVTCGTATVNIVVSSNEVTTVAGGLTEGYAKDIGLKVVGHARSGRYVFLTENGFNTIRRFDPYSGQLVVVAGSYLGKSDSGGVPATSGGFAQPLGLALTPTGEMYVTDKNLIRKIAIDGTVNTIAGNGTSADTGDGGAALSAGFSSTKRLAWGTDGTLYVTTDRAVRGISPNGIVNRVAGSYSASGFAGDGGPALSGLFNTPFGLSTNANGDIYVADVYNDRIRRISKGVITTVAGTGVHGYAAGPLATDAAFSYPYDVSVEASGQLLVADYGNFKVRRFTDGGNIADVAGGGAGGDGVPAVSSNVGYALTVSAGANGDFYFSNDGGLAPRYVNTAGVISSPINGIRKASFAGDGFVGPQTQLNLYGFSGNLAADPSGNLFINDFAANRIRRLDASTKLMSTWAGDGSGLVASPTGQLTFDPNGNLVFIDANCRVRVRMPDGSTPTLAGNTSCGNTGDGGLATSAQINPSVGGLAFNAAGDLYIANKNSSTIRKVDNVTKIISNVAGDQVGGYTGDGGPASAARVNQPSNLQFDGAGNLYLADAGNSVIRMIDTSGIITTVSSGLSFPRSFVVDPSGQLFVADANTNTIGKIGDKVQTLIAGNGLSGATDNATALNSQFNAPTGLAVVGNDLYVADTGNHRIRKIAGVASSTPNALASAKWSIVPAATGHANLRERFTFTTASAVTSSKITTTVPAGFAASTLAVVEAYGLSGTVTPSLSGTTLTLTFPTQALAAGVPISVSLEGVTSPGAVGNSASFTQLFDSAGTSVIGALRTNVVTQASASGPSVGAPGFGSLWKRALTTTPSVFSQVSVSPSSVTDANSSFTLTSAGTINANTSSFGSTVATSSGRTLTAVTADSSTSVTSGAFAINRWGLQITSSTGAATASAGPGVYVGLATTPASLFSNLSATNILTVNTRARINYLQPAGQYKSTLTWRTSGGV